LTKNHINTFVVIAGDSDYTPLISKLRELNKYVIVIGHKSTMSDLLKGYCDEIYFYDNFIGVKPLTEVKISTSKLTLAYSLLTRTIVNLKEHGQKTYGSRVKQFMRQLDSSFDESALGFKNLKEFWNRASIDKIIKYDAIENGDYIIHLYSLNNNDSEIKVSNKKLEINQNVGLTPINDAFYGLVYWSLKASLEICEEEFVEISDVAKTIREFDDSFSLKKYGYSASSGFKKIILDCDQRQIIESKIESNNVYLIRLKSNAVFNQYDKFKPSNYNQVVDLRKLSKETSSFKKQLKDNGFAYNVDDIQYFANQINFLFTETKKTFTISEVQSDIKFNVNEKQINVRSILRTLLESGCFYKDDASKSSSLSDSILIGIKNSKQIEIKVLDFLQSKLRKYNNGIDVEPRILKFIVYAEI